MRKKKSDIYRKGQGRRTDGPEMKQMKELRPKRKPAPAPDRADAVAFYKSYSWKKARARKIKDTPLCEICYAEGKLVPATIIHHLHPLDQGGEQIKQDNLFSIHSEKEHREIHRLLDEGEIDYTRESLLEALKKDRGGIKVRKKAK